MRSRFTPNAFLLVYITPFLTNLFECRPKCFGKICVCIRMTLIQNTNQNQNLVKLLVCGSHVRMIGVRNTGIEQLVGHDER